MENNKTEEIRDGIIEFLKQKYGTAAVKINGCNFAAADIAINEQENPEVYRVTVIRHDTKK